jgi:hypothetical protein
MPREDYATNIRLIACSKRVRLSCARAAISTPRCPSSDAREMSRTSLSALGCGIGQCTPHDPRSRRHRMHDAVFGIKDVHDLNSANM